MEAEELNLESLTKEPCDCQLECPTGYRPGYQMMLFMPIGMCLGLVFGMAIFHNAAVGMCLGMVFGILFGASLDLSGKKNGRANTSPSGIKSQPLPDGRPVLDGGPTAHPDNWDSNSGGIL